MFEEIEKKIETMGIVPVVVVEDVKDALPLKEALKEGGLPVAEVTFRTDCAKEVIRQMSQDNDMFVGAGTVVTTEQADEAIEAGAKFIVSPGFDEEVVTYCIQKDIPVFPGCITPSEIQKAIRLGLHVVKFFPAETYGGLKTIRSLAAPFSSIRFMPTGGINADNVQSYLKDPSIIACGGSWMVNKKLVREGQFEKITALVEEAAELVKQVKV